MTANEAKQRRDGNADAPAGERSASRSRRPARAGRGRRGSRGRRSRADMSERGPGQNQGRRSGGSPGGSRSAGEGRKESGGGGRQRRRRGPQGGNRKRRGNRPQGRRRTDMARQSEALTPDPGYVEPTSVFIYQHIRSSSSRDPDSGLGQRPNWFVRWEDDFDQGNEY